MMRLTAVFSSSIYTCASKILHNEVVLQILIIHHLDRLVVHFPWCTIFNPVLKCSLSGSWLFSFYLCFCSADTTHIAAL